MEEQADRNQNVKQGQSSLKTGIAVAACVLVVAGVFFMRRESPTKKEKTSSPAVVTAIDSKSALPTLLDLGAGKCIPCRMMVPVLDELEKKYSGKFNVKFIDVHKDSDSAEKWRIRSIPTQIFLDARGKELYRHIGFISGEDILARWKELGVDIK